MPVDFLFLRRVVEVLESDLLPLDDSGVEVVYDQDKKARKSKGLSQRKVADMADIVVRTVMHIENYEDNPKMAALYALIRVLEIDPRGIFCPDQDCNAPTVEQLSLLIAQCSEQEAQLLLPAVRAILSAVRNRDDLLVGTIT